MAEGFVGCGVWRRHEDQRFAEGDGLCGGVVSYIVSCGCAMALGLAPSLIIFNTFLFFCMERVWQSSRSHACQKSSVHLGNCEGLDLGRLHIGCPGDLDW